MGLSFKKATKKQAKGRVALIGPSGSGKTFTALAIATGLGGRIAVIDTEHGSASKYADAFEFDALELESFAPATYVEAIHAAEEAGYDVLIIDSLSHAWMGKDGALEQVDRAAKRSNTSNTFGAWRDVTPQHNKLIDAIVGSKCHVIATMRSKTDYSQEKDERGRTVIRKVGLAPVQRDGMEYEFDLVADIHLEGNTMVVSKSRCPALTDGVFPRAGREVASLLRAWLTDGAPAPVAEPQQTAPASEPPASSPDFASLIAAAQSLELLEQIGAEIRKHIGHDSPNRAALADAYKARKAELQAQADNAEAAQ